MAAIVIRTRDGPKHPTIPLFLHTYQVLIIIINAMSTSPRNRVTVRVKPCTTTEKKKKTSPKTPKNMDNAQSKVLKARSGSGLGSGLG